MKKQAKKKVRLVQEVSPEEVISPEEARQTLWNAPLPLEARWWLDGNISKKVLEKAGIPHVYWGRMALEEFETSPTPPGYRLFGTDVPEILRKMGYEVEVVTKEELRKRLELSRAEMERNEVWAKVMKFRRPIDLRMKHAHEFAAMHGLKRLEIDEFFVFSFFKSKKYYSIPYEVWYWCDTGHLHFGRSRVTGRPLLVLSYDTSFIVFADPDTFDAICEEHWQRITRKHDPHYLYFEYLYTVRCLSRPDELGKEFKRWVVERKAHLLDEIRRDYVVVAEPAPIMAEELRRICEELGIEFRVLRNRRGVFYRGVFRKDSLPEDL